MDEERYEITSLLGKGRSGGVYAARDHQLKRNVAIRRFLLLRETPEQDKWAQEFLQESQKICTPKHPGLLDAMVGGVDEDGAFLVTDHIENGQRLTDWVNKKPFDEDSSLDLAHQLLNAFQAAHQQSIFHAALTVGSVMVIPQPDSKPRFIVMDMGLSRLSSIAIEFYPIYAKMANPALLAPEVFDESPFSESADCYMLGQLVYFSLLGGHPFTLKDPSEAEESHRNGSLPPLSNYRADLSKPLIDWVSWLTQPDPAKRPQSTQEALTALPKPKSERPLLLTPSASSPSVPLQKPISEIAISPQGQSSPRKPTSSGRNNSKKTLALGIVGLLSLTSIAIIMTTSPADDSVVEQDYYDSSVNSHSAPSEIDEPVVFFGAHLPLYSVTTGAGHPRTWSDVSSTTNLDWIVFQAPLEQWDRVSRPKVDLIKSASRMGDLKISPIPVGDLLFYNQHKKDLKPNLYGQCSKVGDGWKIEVDLPSTTNSLDLHLTTWNCHAELKLVDENGALVSEIVRYSGHSVNTSFGSRIPLIRRKKDLPSKVFLEITSRDEKSPKGHGLSLNAIVIK